jgi:integrase
MTGKTLEYALTVARSHWGDRPGDKVMLSMAGAGVSHFGASRALKGLGPASGVSLLKFLRDTRKLSPKSAASYYGAFRRMLALSGFQTPDWPKAPTPPRVKAREAMKGDDLGALVEWLDARHPATADLARLLRGTGMRVAVEGLADGHEGRGFTVVERAATYVAIRIAGKGGHERLIPVVDPEAIAVILSPERLRAVQGVSYRTHLKRWRQGVSGLGITTRLATPHAVRHTYGGERLKETGGNLSLVQELMGHASPTTTAGYLSTSLVDKAAAISPRSTPSKE